jgi:hypothetical protein
MEFSLSLNMFRTDRCPDGAKNHRRIKRIYLGSFINLGNA